MGQINVTEEETESKAILPVNIMFKFKKQGKVG